MRAHAWAGFALVAGLFVVFSPPLGAYLARVYGSAPAPGERLFAPVERLVYRLGGIDPSREQRWTAYAFSLVAFSLCSYALLRLQGVLPLNSNGVAGLEPGLAFNTAMSFVANTNWQNYAGEAQLSHLAQMAGLTVQNFVSAAAGMAVLAALARGIARRGADTVGNFWVDVVRGTTRVLLPLAVLVAVFLVTQGVVQSLDGHTAVTTLEGRAQTLPAGPVASQVAIKQLGTNGGGFFGANSSVPYENSTPLSNVVQTWAIAAIPFALAFTYGRMVGNRRHGWVLFAVMLVLWSAVAIAAMTLETAGNPRLADLGVDQSAATASPGGNLEGKELRFGAAASALWAASTTATSNGSVNSMHDSYTPLGGGLLLTNMLLGEVSPGGVGVGLAGLVVLAVLAVFVAGLLVGRTPEYLGKRIGAGEMKLVTLYVLAVPVAVLVLSAASMANPAAVAAAPGAPGPHGLTEIVYGIASAANNNGSAFAGLAGDTGWYNTVQGIAFVVGRWLLIVPVLALAGALARKQPVAPSPATFPTDGITFGVLLLAVTLVLVGLVYFPVLALGPLAEHLAL
jgi:K+-transporting ATPase ATPase A chain